MGILELLFGCKPPAEGPATAGYQQYDDQAPGTGQLDRR